MNITNRHSSSVKESERRHHIVKRTAYLTVPLKVEYSLTEFGKSLEPVLEQMIGVGEHYISLQKNKATEH